MSSNPRSRGARRALTARSRRALTARSRRPLTAPALLLAACGALSALAAGCGASFPASAAAPGKPRVVAAENFWGSLAKQLGGDRVVVSSLIVNPDTDPHAYDPTVADAVGLARSDMAIVNGIGYDRWSSQLLAADAPRPPIVLDVGDLLGLREGANPHQWYSPASVERVITAIAADYERLDPRDAAYFERRRIEIEQRGLAGYRRMLALIRGRYHGVAVGYSESIFEPLGRALGLRLLTPARFARAIAEGTEVSAGDTRTVEAQARNHEIDVWVYNRQNTTPDVERANQAARAAHIPIVAITETLAPASASFQQWQVSELTGLLRALEEATGR